MRINWNVRIKSLKFWVTLIPSVLLVGQAVAAVFGYNWDISVLGSQLTNVVNTLFGVLVVLGVVVDPTTEGISDSNQAMNNVILTKAQQIENLKTQIDTLTGYGADEPTEESAGVPDGK